MSRWFRHYAGMMRDEKLVRVAVKAKQPVERVVWVWGAILESAAEINDGGRYEFDAGEAAYFLRCDEDELVRIVGELEGNGRVHGQLVVRWSDRQFDSDSAKNRQRRYRERLKAGGDVQQRNDDMGEASRRVTRDVTPPSCDGAVTPQETDTETEEEVGASAPTSPEPAKAAPVAVIGLPTVSDGDFPIVEADVVEWATAYPGVDVRQQLAAMRSWLIANPTRRKTKRGMRKFVVAWLDRRQNAGASHASRQTDPPPSKPTGANIWTSEAKNTGLIDEPSYTASGRLGAGHTAGHHRGPVATLDLAVPSDRTGH